MIKTLALAAFLAVAPAAAFAHGAPPAPAHGGQVVEDSAEHWVELVLQDDTLTAYVLDENKVPVPAAQLSGKATVLVGGKPHMWTAPSSQGVLQCFDQIACVHMSGLLMRSHMSAGQDGFRDRGSKQNGGLR